MIVDDTWKVVGVGEKIILFGKLPAMASYCCRLCEAPVLTKHTVAIFTPTAREQQ